MVPYLAFFELIPNERGPDFVDDSVCVYNRYISIVYGSTKALGIAWRGDSIDLTNERKERTGLRRRAILSVDVTITLIPHENIDKNKKNQKTNKESQQIWRISRCVQRFVR